MIISIGFEFYSLGSLFEKSSNIFKKYNTPNVFKGEMCKKEIGLHDLSLCFSLINTP